jgi:hypothetical protein
MSKKKLSLGEIINLEAEINGVSNQQTGEVLLKGLLAENINLVIKYRLTKLAESLASDKKTLDDMRNDLVKKYGESDGKGAISVETHLDKAKTQINPKFELFAKEYNTLLAEQKEIDFPTITLEDIKDVKSEGFYGTFLKLITEETEEVEVIEG